MQAVVFEGKNKVTVQDVVRITIAAICGSDLHMYEERSGAEARHGVWS